MVPWGEALVEMCLVSSDLFHPGLVDILKSVADEMVSRMVIPEFATTKLALVHEYREVSELDRAWDIEQTLQKRILKEIWR